MSQFEIILDFMQKFHYVLSYPSALNDKIYSIFHRASNGLDDIRLRPEKHFKSSPSIKT